MKTNCNIIKDLMVLYELDTCSEESKSAIEEHIKTCEGCRKIWKFKTDDHVEKEIKEQSSEEFEKLQKNIRRKNRKKIIIGACILSVFIIGIFQGIRFLKSSVECNADEIEISNVYQDGDEMGFKVTLTDGNTWGEHSGYTGGSSIITEKGWEFTVFRSRFSKKVVDDTDISMYVTIYGIPEKIYYGTGEEAVLLWKKGDSISPLTEEIQQDMDEVKSE